MNEQIKKVAMEVISKNLPAYTTMKKNGFDSGEDMTIFWFYFDEIMAGINSGATI